MFKLSLPARFALVLSSSTAWDRGHGVIKTDPAVQKGLAITVSPTSWFRSGPKASLRV